MATETIATNILRFMELRSPYAPLAKSMRQNLILDDVIGKVGESTARFEVDLQAKDAPSAIGRFVY